MKSRWDKKTNLLFILLIGYTVNMSGQIGDYYLGYQKYSFIKYDENKYIIPESDTTFSSLFSRFDSLIIKGSGKINIVHMGGSHIQADMYTHVMRKQLQQLSPDMNGGRGLVFPFKLAKTNNPSNYSVQFTGSWTSCKSTRPTEPCVLGLLGISASTTDSIASISIRLPQDIPQPSSFNRIRAFHEPTNYQLLVNSGDKVYFGNYDSLQGCTIFNLDEDATETEILFRRDSTSAEVTFMGVSLDIDNPGITYNSVGVNGARLSSYLRCELYIKQLAAVQPDLVIFSIGTNDGYTRRFNKEKYFLEYRELLKRTREAAPNAAILITVPNDSYLYKRYVNNNTALIQKEIFKLAKEYNCGVWDFYTIMGGLNSSQAWYSLKLMQYDRIHFTRKGYKLKGELFFSAFLKAWEGRWQINPVN